MAMVPELRDPATDLRWLLPLPSDSLPSPRSAGQGPLWDLGRLEMISDLAGDGLALSKQTLLSTGHIQGEDSTLRIRSAWEL